jgi:hypothetical protein
VNNSKDLNEGFGQTVIYRSGPQLGALTLFTP